MIPTLDRLPTGFPPLHPNRAKWLCYAGIALLVALTVLIMGCSQPAFAGEIVNVQRLADAIYKAENSKRHPYGILAHYKTTTPRQACINTINSALRRYAKAKSKEDFIVFLGRTYCPVGCSNDNGTNRFWVRNVQYYYARLTAR